MRAAIILGLVAVAAAVPLSSPIDGVKERRELDVRSSELSAPAGAPIAVEKRAPIPQGNTITTVADVLTSVLSLIVTVTAATLTGATAITTAIANLVTSLVSALQTLLDEAASGVITLTTAQVTAITNAIASLNVATTLQAVLSALQTLVGAL